MKKCSDMLQDDNIVILNQTLKKFNFDDYVVIIKKDDYILYELKNLYKNQNWSKNIVFNKENLYSFKYACEYKLQIENCSEWIRASENLSFSNSCGYYDPVYNTVFDYELYNEEDIVILHNGNKCHIDDACYIDDEGEYFLESDCVYSSYYERSILENNAVDVRGYGYVLRDDDDFFCCDDCDEWYHADDYACDELCENCYEKESISDSAYGYSTNVLHYCEFGEAQNLIKGKGIFCGIELETCYTEYSDEAASDLFKCEQVGYAIPTQDGSLNAELGVEFVFKPDNFKNYKKHLNNFIENYERYLEKDSGNGYGLHIHVSSHFLNKSCKVRIQNFIENYEYNFRQIGGRNSTNYQKSKNKDYKLKLKHPNDAKYQMVNICPKGTIEFRFPKAIIDIEHILINIELAHAVTMYCYANFHIYIVSDFNHFAQFVAQNKKEYKRLNAYFSSL